MATDAFSAQIVQLVRNMPDEAILELVKNRLGMAPFRDLRQHVSAPRAHAGRAPVVQAKSTRAAAPEKRPAAPTRKAPTGLHERKETLESVARVVIASTGLSASEVARAAGIPQPRAAAALKELKLEKRIFQGGDRRFARYAGEARVADAASLAARTSAPGPTQVKKSARAKRPRSAK